LTFVLVVLAAPHIYAQVSVDFGISGAGKKYYRPYGYGSTLDAVTLGLSLEKDVLKHTSLRAVGRFASFYHIGNEYSVTSITTGGEYSSNKYEPTDGTVNSYILQIEAVQYGKKDGNKLGWYVFGGGGASFHTFKPVTITNLNTQETRIIAYPDALFPGIQAGAGLTRDMSRKIDLYLQWQFAHYFPVAGQQTNNGKNDVQFPTFSIGIKFKPRH
jgi:hypothetical protein